MPGVGDGDWWTDEADTTRDRRAGRSVGSDESTDASDRSGDETDPSSDETDRSMSETERSLQVEFVVDPARPCPVVAMGDVREVHQRIGGDVCRTDILVEGSGTDRTLVAHYITEVGPSCACPIFDAFDCIPEIVDVDGGLRIRTFVADRETLAALVAALRATTSSVRLRSITETPTVEGDGNTVYISLDRMTETQRETLRTAVAQGYYMSPRATSLEELAEEFGVSKSAVSRRLNAAENKLLAELFPCAD